VKPLIISSSYIASKFRQEEVSLSTRLMRRLNPDAEILLVDSASPFNPATFAHDVNYHVRMEDNIGHPTAGGDGWGRDFCFGLQFAIDRGYDWVIFIESDMLLFRPCQPIIDKLLRIGCYAAAPISFRYQWLETGIMFLYVPMLIATKFVERYAWPKHRPPFFCEPEVERLLAEELLILPLRGARDDDKELTSTNIVDQFPFGIDYLSHASDLGVYRAALGMNGLEELAPEGAVSGWRSTYR
jgi:hypothetical protein